jgi:hypothetical protein
VWLGVKLELSDGTRVFWHKSQSVTVTLPSVMEKYRSGRETGREVAGDRRSQSLPEFVRTHSGGFVALVVEAVEGVLSAE